MGKKIYSFDEDVLKTPTPEFAYFLGWAWSDGYLSNRAFSIEIISDDGDEVFDHFKTFCSFKPFYRRQREGRHRTSRMHICNMKLVNFLKSHDYRIKSHTRPDSILNYLPAELVQFWLRGFFEGDGSLLISKQSLGDYLGFRMEFYGPIDQDWGFLENITNEPFKIIKRTRDCGSSSIASLGVATKINKIGSFLYSSRNDIKLSRKFCKFSTLSDYLESKEKKEFTRKHCSNSPKHLTK